jgi:hypothetical protein
MLLHEHKDYSDLIAAVSDAMGIDPTLVEKDYWIMHCLWGLQQQGFRFELKGGTSLSKGFGLIHRFSEDIDITTDSRVLPMTADLSDPGHSKTRIKKLLEEADRVGAAYTRDVLFPRLYSGGETISEVKDISIRGEGVKEVVEMVQRELQANLWAMTSDSLATRSSHHLCHLSHYTLLHLSVTHSAP